MLDLTKPTNSTFPVLAAAEIARLLPGLPRIYVTQTQISLVWRNYVNPMRVDALWHAGAAALTIRVRVAEHPAPIEVVGGEQVTTWDPTERTCEVLCRAHIVRVVEGLQWQGGVAENLESDIYQIGERVRACYEQCLAEAALLQLQAST